MNPVLSPIGGSTGFIFGEIKLNDKWMPGWELNDRMSQEWEKI